MILKQIFEPRLAQYSYLVGSEQTREAIIVDPMCVGQVLGVEIRL